jgi:hypothetical protein
MPHQFNDFAKPHIQLNAQGKVTGALHVERLYFPWRLRLNWQRTNI